MHTTKIFHLHLDTAALNMSLVKKPKTELSTHVVSNHATDTSIQLIGHSCPVLACDLSAEKAVLSGDLEGSVKLWKLSHDDTVEQYEVGKHKGAVLGAIFLKTHMVTCSTDTTISVFDGGHKIRNFKGHTAAVNVVCGGQNGELILSGSDDGSIGIWDPREKDSESRVIETSYPVVAVATDGHETVWSAGVDDAISKWDLRMNQQLDFQGANGHSDIVTSLSYNNNRLASHSHDNTVRVWDTKPFMADEKSRELLCLTDAPNGIEQATLKARWSSDGEHIIAGSADRTVAIWKGDTGRLVRKVGGHSGCVNDVAMVEKWYVSASSDGTLVVSSL